MSGAATTTSTATSATTLVRPTTFSNVNSYILVIKQLSAAHTNASSQSHQQ